MSLMQICEPPRCRDESTACLRSGMAASYTGTSVRLNQRPIVTHAVQECQDQSAFCFLLNHWSLIASCRKAAKGIMWRPRMGRWVGRAAFDMCSLVNYPFYFSRTKAHVHDVMPQGMAPRHREYSCLDPGCLDTSGLHLSGCSHHRNRHGDLR